MHSHSEQISTNAHMLCSSESGSTTLQWDMWKQSLETNLSQDGQDSHHCNEGSNCFWCKSNDLGIKDKSWVVENVQFKMI